MNLPNTNGGHTSEYGTIEIDWQPVLKPTGEPVTSKDGTKIVESPVMTLTPKLQGEYGGWAFEDLDGFWTYQGAATNIVQGAPSEVVLSLGGHKQNGTRYQNISRIKALGATSAPDNGTFKTQYGQSSNAPAPVTSLSGDDRETRRNNSIREQSFYNNLNPEMLDRLPLDKHKVLLAAYFDTAMLLLRESVRKRALSKLDQPNEPELDVPDTPMIDAVIEAGGIVTGVTGLTTQPANNVESAPPPAEDVQQLPW